MAKTHSRPFSSIQQGWKCILSPPQLGHAPPPSSKARSAREGEQFRAALFPTLWVPIFLLSSCLYTDDFRTVVIPPTDSNTETWTTLLQSSFQYQFSTELKEQMHTTLLPKMSCIPNTFYCGILAEHKQHLQTHLLPHNQWQLCVTRGQWPRPLAQLPESSEKNSKSAKYSTFPIFILFSKLWPTLLTDKKQIRDNNWWFPLPSHGAPGQGGSQHSPSVSL